MERILYIPIIQKKKKINNSFKKDRCPKIWYIMQAR